MLLGFLDHMRVVPDHRIAGMVTYPIDEVLLATLVGVVCGADDWEGVEEVTSRALEWLRGFVPFASGIPTARTGGRVFACGHACVAAARFCGLGRLSSGRSTRSDCRGRRDAARFEDVAGTARARWVCVFGLRHRGGARARPAERSTESRTRSRRSRNSWTCSPSRARSCRSTPWDRGRKSPGASSTKARVCPRAQRQSDAVCMRTRRCSSPIRSAPQFAR